MQLFVCTWVCWFVGVFVCLLMRASTSAREREQEREGEFVCERETEREIMCMRDKKSCSVKRGSVCVRVRERESERV